MNDKRGFGPPISSNVYQNLIILVSTNGQFSNLNIHTSHASKTHFRKGNMRFDYTPGYASLQAVGVGKRL